MRRTPINRAVTSRAFAVFAVCAALLLGATGCTGPSPAPAPSSASASATPTVRPTQTASPTVTPTPVATATPPATTTPPSDPGTDQAAAAKADVVQACQTWQTSLSQDASTFPATQAQAVTIAQSAAAVDTQWQPVVDTMQVLVSLIPDTSADGVAKGQQAFTQLGNECAAVGVVVSAG